MMLNGSETYLRRFLEVNWLKPFDAVWDASVASVLESIPMEEPSLDLGCGDGLFMLVASGGRARLSYDRYTDTRLQLRGDLYDTGASTRRIEATPPRWSFTVGLDHKAGLLDKAQRTATYRFLVQADGQALPFHDRTFATVFCNILSWLPDWRAGLLEMRRVLRPGGQLVLVVPDGAVGERLHAYHRARKYEQSGRRFAARFFDWIDNGRFNTLARLTGNRHQWRERLADAGLSLRGGYPVLAGEAVTRWDFSTRPFLHGLILMGRWLQALRLKAVVKQLIVPLVCWRMRPWLQRSLDPPRTACGLWVLIAESRISTEAEAMRSPAHMGV